MWYYQNGEQYKDEYNKYRYINKNVTKEKIQMYKNT